MKTFLSFIFIYLAFLVQTAIMRYSPDLVLLLLLVFALYETKKVVLWLSLFAGLCLDLVNPMTFGFNLIICLVAGFGVNALQEIIYQSNRYLIVLMGIVLVFKYLLGFLIFKASPPLFDIIISGLITLILVLPIESIVRHILPNQWKLA
jgi:rod shape-determining protein MreD